MTLDDKEAEALLFCASYNVGFIDLGYHGPVTLNWKILGKYNGRGMCYIMRFWKETLYQNRDDIKHWASGNGWKITSDDVNHLTVESYDANHQSRVQRNPKRTQSLIVIPTYLI